VNHNGVKIVGYTNYPAMMATDSSSFFSRNIVSLFDLFVKQRESGESTFLVNLEDDIIEASMLVHQGILRMKK
jgi:NAD(P) transhydrogenase subunit alpha